MNDLFYKIICTSRSTDQMSVIYLYGSKYYIYLGEGFRVIKITIAHLFRVQKRVPRVKSTCRYYIWSLPPIFSMMQEATCLTMNNLSC